MPHLPPVECGFGVRPIVTPKACLRHDADRSRPDLKSDTSGNEADHKTAWGAVFPPNATSALAVIGPIPGIVCRRCAASLAFASAWISAVIPRRNEFDSLRRSASRPASPPDHQSYQSDRTGLVVGRGGGAGGGQRSFSMTVGIRSSIFLCVSTSWSASRFSALRAGTGRSARSQAAISRSALWIPFASCRRHASGVTIPNAPRCARIAFTALGSAGGRETPGRCARGAPLVRRGSSAGLAGRRFSQERSAWTGATPLRETRLRIRLVGSAGIRFTGSNSHPPHCLASHSP
jgi:hypothetical protein